MSGGKGSRRRWPYVVVGTLVVVGAVAWVVWYWWLPSYRPDLEQGERYGVDVSNHQGAIDWDRVARDDISFAFIKATEGGDFVDAQFAQNWEGAASAGLERGAYHYFTLCRSGIDQARNFLAVAHEEDADLPPALDLELAGNCSARPSRAEVLRQLRRFLDRVEASAGQPVLLYLGHEFEARYHVRAALGRPLWHRRILVRPDVEPWVVWQVHFRADVDGIDGPADLNVMRPY